MSAETGAQLATAEQLPLEATMKPTAAEEAQIAFMQDAMIEFGLEDPHLQLQFVMAMNKAQLNMTETNDCLGKNPSLQCRACKAAVGSIIKGLAGKSCAVGCAATKVLAPFVKVCAAICATIAKGVTNTEWICSQGFWNAVGGPPC